MMKEADYWIEKLQLEKHPEGGWFKEVYRAEKVIPGEYLQNESSGNRSISTSIYYLLKKGDFSAFHRIRSDEIWHYYTGSSVVEILSLEQGIVSKRLLGNTGNAKGEFQLVVPANTWFAARLVNSDGFALVGCTVSPGFHFADFELASEKLADFYPDHRKEVLRLIR